ncbi:MAG TPA: phosphoenolpyruvate carboxykinase (GTP) [Nitrospirae bacterium]|nr:phosphoenolpyruvate carboxykinase (GTP) [Nitrospirota bacterium]
MTMSVHDWVDDQARLLQPERIYWVDGTREEMQQLIEIGMAQEKINNNNTFYKLNHREFPGAYYHRSHPQDVARTEHLTYVCLPSREDAGPVNNWMDPDEAKSMMLKLFEGSMRGRTMYVIPFSMGHPDSPYAKHCVQITDSVYVVVNMWIMTRVGRETLKKIGETGSFVKGLHSIGDLNPQRRYIMHFPQDDLVMSFGSGYGGNALLGKKCISLRLASYQGYRQGWLAEHMIIVGVETPDGEIYYFLGAFPSACGKTNLAMLEPVLEGYRVWTLGDDIAWLNIGPDGRLYAINPETGFFGVAPGTSYKTNPNMMQTLKNDRFFPTLFTNTAIDRDNNTPWWEDMTETVPANLIDWLGEPYDPSSGKPAAHPNSRFTASIYNCPTLSSEVDNPAGVPISGIIFGGRRSTTMPLVVESRDWAHGVFLASTMGSETTTAATGKVGVVRRDPMAMRPFCGYHMAEYFRHWLQMGSRLKDVPRIFMVNWFRKDEQGRFIWPGFRENSRVLKWMIDRIRSSVDARETPIGYVPYYEDMVLEGLNLDRNTFEKLTEIDRDEWLREVEEIDSFYGSLGSRLPGELKGELVRLRESL